MVPNLLRRELNPRGVIYNKFLEGGQGIEWICAIGMFLHDESKGGFVKGAGPFTGQIVEYMGCG